MLTEKDHSQIAEHGLNLEKVEEQIENFKKGFPPAVLERPAIEGDGIINLDEDEIDQAIDLYERSASQKKIVKFVPASGAATRMFKNLFAFQSEYDESEMAYEKMLEDQSSGSPFEFFKNLEKFAFYEDLKKTFKNSGMALEEAHLKRKFGKILDYFLGEEGLNYGNLPKGLLKFHLYENGARTPVEEHMVEGSLYALGAERSVNIHFTVSPEHKENFEKHVAEVKSLYEQRFDCKINVSYSIQNPGTDTVAVEMNNEPFRNEDGTILFRPAGHGALLENLDAIDADIIFIKNIDNVVPDSLKEETVTYKKVLAGVLLDRQQKIFNMLSELESGENEEVVKKAHTLLIEELGYIPGKDSLSGEELKKLLNRPLRVCGMVKSDGDPGGGPFWIKDTRGNVSLQIVETAQIDLTKQDQKEVFKRATHFNPVDLVCSPKDHEGNKFDLMNYRDPSAGFITQKSKDGKDLKAQELPGLWNGSMAHWNTIFVEVPLITFNPVKQVNDLLKKEHQ